MGTEFGTIMQHGYIVHDVEATAREWVERVGVGPFYILDELPMDDYRYRGERVDLTMKLAFAYWGSVQIELIQPLTSTKTLYTDALQSSPGVLNHCATLVPDLDALLAKHNLENRVIQAGAMPTGTRFVYLEEYLPGGHHLELVQAPESAQAGFAAMEAISREWDGTRPLRRMADLGDDMAAR